jgi:peroxiredoxin
MTLTESKQIELGSSAPDFELPGVDGNQHALADYDDADVLVVMFICNHCPYVKAIRERLIQLVNDFDDASAAFVGINSNNAEEYPEDSFERMREIADAWSYPFDYLRDESQQVARAFGAVCTPDFFVYDSDRQLRYRGRLDDSPREPDEVSSRDLRRAIDTMLDGQHPDPDDQHPSMGCNIKWR